MATCACPNATGEAMLIQPNIRYITDIYFAFGALSALPQVLKNHNIKNPLVVTDRGLVNIGMTDRLRLSNVVIYDGVETNPVERMAREAANMYTENNCDGLIALGGGSPIDLAKCAGILIDHKAPLSAYAFIEGGSSAIKKIPPLVAISTTAGSGSEVGRAALITLDEGKKLAFISDHLLPVATICDPDLMREMPSQLVAATGMDALSHCIECYLSTRTNPVAEAIALDGFERGFRNIVRASIESNREARYEMMMCSLEGGLAFQKGLGAVHSLSHPLGALTHKKLHHGTLNAIFLPHVLRYNADYCENKMMVMAEKMKIDNISEIPAALSKLIDDVRLPARLRDLGVSRSELQSLPPLAMRDHCTATNPRPLKTEDFAKLYSDAW
jgi:4-hydroxybutyrate dehydrogenase